MILGRLSFVFIAIASAQSSSEQQLQDLLSEAHLATPQRWAQLLIQADAIADKMVRGEKPPDGLRRVRIEGFELIYGWNEIQQSENYGHQLLKTVIHAQEGTPSGADALVALLGNPDFALGLDGGMEWVRPYKVVIEILQSRRWQALHDPRLDRILGEAYETWWSLSKIKRTDPLIVDMGLAPEDFAEGADTARRNAIAAYERVLRVSPGDQELSRRVTQLKARRNTNQYRWFPGGD